jgi:hypothetical protein
MAIGESGLEQLLQAEERLSRMLEDEARQAEALVAAADAEASALAERLEQELAGLARNVEDRLAVERDARLAFAEEDARRRVTRFEAFTPGDIAALADWVVHQVLASGSEPG